MFKDKIWWIVSEGGEEEKWNEENKEDEEEWKEETRRERKRIKDVKKVIDDLEKCSRERGSREKEKKSDRDNHLLIKNKKGRCRKEIFSE